MGLPYICQENSSPVIPPVTFQIPHHILLTSRLLCNNSDLHTPVRQQQQQRKTYVNTDLSICPFVFVRHDGVKRSLQAPYEGPFHVLNRHHKHYTLDISGWQKVVALDRLKPAYVDDKYPSDSTLHPDNSVTLQPSSSSVP